MEKAIKQRLLGGLVLVAGAILFLPMLLDGSGAALTVPPMPAPPVVAGVEEISPNLEAAVAEAEQSVASVHAEVPETDAAALVEEDVKPDIAAVAPATAPVPSPAQNEASRLAEEKAAQAKAAAAKAAAEKAAQEKLAREKAAQEAKAKAEQEKARVTAQASQPETKPVAAAPEAAALPTAWVVQVASLSTRDKADDLAQRLRQKSYRAVVQQQGGAWRVLVGPELRREVAESVKARLAADPEFKLDGWLQAYKP